MQLETIADDGKTLVVERRLTLRCHLCAEAMLVCPADQDEWAWLSSEVAQSFLAQHRREHGSDRIAGAQVEFFEKV